MLVFVFYGSIVFHLRFFIVMSTGLDISTFYSSEIFILKKSGFLRPAFAPHYAYRQKGECLRSQKEEPHLRKVNCSQQRYF